MEALAFARDVLADFRMGSHAQQAALREVRARRAPVAACGCPALRLYPQSHAALASRLWQVTALLCYEDPSSSPLASYLQMDYLEGTADVLNAAILSHLRAPSHSALEGNLKQLVVTHTALRQATGSPESVFRLPL